MIEGPRAPPEVPVWAFRGERKVKVLGKCRGGSITLSVSVGMKAPLPSEWTVITPTVCSVGHVVVC